MALHKTIQKVLMIGVRLPVLPMPAKPQPPAALVPLIAAIAGSHQGFNQQAIKYGHRYRSAFWAIYLLSALAVLCAVLPLALGWDDEQHALSRFAVMWVIAESLVIFLVGLIYWRGHQQNWQGQWFAARTKAELAWYLPMIAPLVDFNDKNGSANWYARIITSEYQDLHTPADDDIQALCRSLQESAAVNVTSAWSDPVFPSHYARWAIDILEGQRHYHQHVAHHQHALLHRVHKINTWLFGLTAIAAVSHLVIHSKVLTVMTTFFPALGASLHGALAQSEAYRLEATSLRLDDELAQSIVEIRQASINAEHDCKALRIAIHQAVSLILDEHKDWHMLVRPHHLPLG